MPWAFLDLVPEEDRRRLLAATTRRRFARREVLFHEGDLADTVHLVDRGRVAVRVMTPLGDVATLRVRGAGTVVGELALLQPTGRRSATVLALERTETLVLHRDAFAAVRRDHPDVEQFLVSVLADEVVRLSNLLVEALYVPADARVLRRLVELAREYGAGEGAPEIPLTQEDLASMAGTSRATVNRILATVERDGVVAVGRGRITVTDVGGLTARAR